MKYECTEERFLADVKEHKMLIMRDDGLYRHLRFKKQGSMSHYFDIVTWRGYLAVTGDMGTYVFSRLDDMFNFFGHVKEGDPLRINKGYWGEKLQAPEHMHVLEFDPDRFVEVVTDRYNDWLEENDVGTDAAGNRVRAELWDALTEEVLDERHDGEYAAIKAATEFSWQQDGTGLGHYIGEFNMPDFYEHGLRDYQYQYIWVLYAIVWGIQQYDKYWVAEREAIFSGDVNKPTPVVF